MEAYLNPHLGDANDFIAQHIKLVHHIAKKFGNLIKGSFGYDDMISAGTMGLWKAYRTFDPTNGAKWATYASRCIENEFLMAFRRQRKDRQTVNLESVLNTDAEGNQLTLADLLAAPPDDQTVADVESFMRSLSENDRRILQMRMDGERQRDIANVREQSQSYMSRRLKQIGRKYLEGRWRTMATVITMTREEYLAERASGKKRAQIANDLGLKHQAYLYPQLEKWGIKGREDENEAIRHFAMTSIKADKPSPELVAELKKSLEEAASTNLEPEIQQPSPVVQKLVSLAESEITHKPSSEAVEPSKASDPIPVPFEPQTPFVSLPVTIDIAKLMFDALATQAYQTAVDKGWHQTDAHLPTQLALIHSEVSEALEAGRKGFGQNQVAEELADIVIRVMDTAKSHRLDIAGALIDKMERNKHRSYRHGNMPY